ncbi:TSUP family transporter [Niabella yanshanensis]|uniref:Probable membrane transporter protein n=1 Tax=Niabella yanshanensis TaxID=577386 RepID=A0ABZ0WAE8_9BACT|nr:TSUP family transporter [Niabella yanshanensis]WQD40252.1 TSUP family transporter [Niabella yanshanensis]
MNDEAAVIKKANEAGASFPFLLRMEGLRVLVIGGDNMAIRHLKEIDNSAPGAEVRIIAEQLSEDLKGWADTHGKVVVEDRPYDPFDIQHADAVIIATGDFALINQINSDAAEYGLANVRIGQSALHTENVDGNALSTAKGGLKGLSNKRIATYALAAFGFMLIGHMIFSYWPFQEIRIHAVNLYSSLDRAFLIMLAAGFVAQLVDGALGMGYGVASTTILLSAGVSPAAISGSIHTAEMFASGASGYSHYKFGNVNKKLFKTLLLPGVVGAIAGAVLLVYLGEKFSDWVRPILAVYTLFLGVKILSNAFKKKVVRKKFRRYGALAGAGGFLDSFGGGGWGPLVTTTLITKGRTPKYVIGSVSLTEFFVTLSSAFTFFILLGVSHWQTIVGLIIGGLIAAPFAAKLAGRLPRRTAFILLGVLVIVWSARILIKLL